MAETAIKLYFSVTEVLVKIVTEKCLKRIIEYICLNDSAVLFALDENDCPAFETFILKLALCSSSSFLSRSHHRIYTFTLFRPWDLCKQNYCRSLCKGIDRKYELCVSTHGEARRVEDLIKIFWPVNFSNSEWNLVITIALYDKYALTQKTFNGSAIPILFKAFGRQLCAHGVALSQISPKLFSKNENGNCEETLVTELEPKLSKIVFKTARRNRRNFALMTSVS